MVNSRGKEVGGAQDPELVTSQDADRVEAKLRHVLMSGHQCWALGRCHSTPSTGHLAGPEALWSTPAGQDNWCYWQSQVLNCPPSVSCQATKIRPECECWGSSCTHTGSRDCSRFLSLAPLFIQSPRGDTHD